MCSREWFCLAFYGGDDTALLLWMQVCLSQAPEGVPNSNILLSSPLPPFPRGASSMNLRESEELPMLHAWGIFQFPHKTKLCVRKEGTNSSASTVYQVLSIRWPTSPLCLRWRSFWNTKTGTFGHPASIIATTYFWGRNYHCTLKKRKQGLKEAICLTWGPQGHILSTTSCYHSWRGEENLKTY